MQIFILSLDPVENATFYMDKHVIKTPAEIQQILVNACARMNEPFPQIRTQHGLPLLPKPSITTHPLTKWASRKENFRFIKLVGLTLCQEYLFRFGRQHLNFNNLWSFPDFVTLDSETQFHRFPWMIPMQFQNKEAGLIESYRAYYIQAKNHMAVWTLRQPPPWYPKEKIEEGRIIAKAFERAKKHPVDFNGLLLDLRNTKTAEETE